MRSGNRFRYWQYYAFIVPAVVYYIVFHYIPMYGAIIAFKDFKVGLGIWGSPFVGLRQFERFFESYVFERLLINTLEISFYQMLLFPVSIIVALAFHELTSRRFRKFVQTVTYAPHFISVVVMVGMLFAFLNPASGIVNRALGRLGIGPVHFLADPAWFKTIFVLSGEWQNLGWGAIVYLAALSAIDPQLHEAAKVDGAGRLQRIWHINLPGILPTIIILLILNFGNFMAVGFEKIYLMQNPLNMPSSDVIQTYVYRTGLLEGQYSYSAAIGLFNSVINCALLLLFNRIARQTTQTSLW